MEKTLNMLTFYDPNNSQVTDEAKELINDSKVIMEAIINRWINVLNDERNLKFIIQIILSSLCH